MAGRKVASGFGERGSIMRGNALEIYSKLNKESYELLHTEEGELKNPENFFLVGKFLEKVLPLCGNNSPFSKETCEWVASELKNIKAKKPSSVESQIEHTLKFRKELAKIIDGFR